MQGKTLAEVIKVSIHAPVMDAKIFGSKPCQSYSFNPRARDGREHKVLWAVPVLTVSIHAPVMDANTRKGVIESRSSFNPRARDGRELAKWWAIRTG